MNIFFYLVGLCTSLVMLVGTARAWLLKLHQGIDNDGLFPFILCLFLAAYFLYRLDSYSAREKKEDEQ